jgi:hypothetical protein
MSIFRSDTIGSWTRGGQATVHNVRIGPREDEESHGLRQQSRPGKPWKPSKPA